MRDYFEREIFLKRYLPSQKNIYHRKRFTPIRKFVIISWVGNTTPYFQRLLCRPGTAKTAYECLRMLQTARTAIDYQIEELLSVIVFKDS